jgi:hypothetical protein
LAPQEMPWYITVLEELMLYKKFQGWIQLPVW